MMPDDDDYGMFDIDGDGRCDLTDLFIFKMIKEKQRKRRQKGQKYDDSDEDDG